jgi:membrane fusion protein (multidrug efflux system)
MRKLALGVCLSSFLLINCTDNPQQSAQGPQEGAKQGEQAASQKDQKQPPKQVNAITIQAQSISMSSEIPGRVRAFKTAEIRPQVSGIIQSRLYQEGSFVEKGQQLYQIDPALYETNYQSAKANLQNARAEVEIASALQNRYGDLIKTNAVSEQEYDEAKASLAKAQAAVELALSQLETAKINVDYTKVIAPISGYIGPSSVTIGALVTAQQQASLAVIRQLDPVYVDLSQSAEKAPQIQQSLMSKRLENPSNAQFEVSIVLDNSGTRYPQTGVMYATDLSVDQSTGRIMLRSVFPNPNAVLLPGMFVRATINNAQAQRSIIVPQKAVIIEADGSKVVWIVDDKNMARKRKVVSNATYKNNWIIESGLQQGDKVIVEGLMMLKPGAKVDPSNIDISTSAGHLMSSNVKRYASVLLIQDRKGVS